MVSKNVFVQTYGCTSNKADSQIMMGLLEQAGYTITSKEYDADYLIINSCAVKSNTEEKIIHRLKQLSRLNKKLIITGCLTKVNFNRIKNVVPDFSAVLDSRSIHKIVDIMRQIENGNERIIQFSNIPPEKPTLPRVPFSKVIDIIKVSEGCLSKCFFCATKIARGNLYSYRPDAIRDLFKLSLNESHREFHITSEDNSTYGLDIETNLPELLESITKIEGKFLIRVGMMNPLHLKKILKDLIRAYKNEKVFKFLHIPVQSFSDKVLKDMNRKYTVNDFLHCVESFRKEIPDITIATDIITGYPTETEDDHELNIAFLRKMAPNVVNLSRFGVRLNTPAAKLKELPKSVLNRRSKEISETMREVFYEKNQKWVGWKGEVIVDERNDGFFTGRNFAYKPIVIRDEKNIFGKFVKVKITDAKSNYLIGEII